MPVSFEGKLVVAISSRALFDFEDENRVFEASDDRAYMALQLERLETAAPPAPTCRCACVPRSSPRAARRHTSAR